MESPDPEGLSMLARVIGAAGAVIVPSWIGWNWLDKRFARKHTVANELQVVSTELGLRREQIDKLFERLEEHARRDEQIFRELMTKMADNHSELMRELGRKADRKVER